MGTGIKNINESAFASCPELTDVYCYAESVPSTSSTAFNDSYIEYAKVGGAMLMKGDEVGAYAQTLKVGKDLIFNTNTGSIVVVDAQVGNNSYFSIDGPGKQIEIENIKTGHDLTGDLIVVSNSKKNNDNYIRIVNAVAANKLIINSFTISRL